MEELPRIDNQKVVDSDYKGTVDLFTKDDVITPSCVGLQKVNLMVTKVRGKNYI